MAASSIVDQYGRPIVLRELPDEVATGGMMSIRQVWHDSVARGLTPAKLAQILEAAAQGDAYAYLTLCEEIEERNPHYAAVLGVRKRAVSGLPVVVDAASEDAADEKLAAFVRELTEQAGFAEMVDDLLDAYGKGYSVVEILWARGAQYLPRGYAHRDPRWFRYDRDTGRELRLIDEANAMDGVPLKPGHFIVHQPRLKTGLQIRNGLYRMVAVADLCKSYAQKDWMAFIEVFGMPLRLGKYGPNASPEDVRILKRAVATIGSDAAAVMPESMKIEFIEAVKASGGDTVYQVVCDWLDRQISKAVLGQTMTTDAQSAGLGSNQASVHNDVREDILRSDVRQLQTTLNRDWVKVVIDANFGPQERYPKLALQIAEPEDLKLLSESLPAMVDIGMEVPEKWAREKFGVPERENDEKLLGRVVVSVPPAEPDIPALNRQRLALNAEQQAARDEVDRIVDDGLKDWDEQLEEAVIGPVEQLAAESADAEEFLRRLPEIARDVTPAKLLRALALGAFKARGLGDATDKV